MHCSFLYFKFYFYILVEDCNNLYKAFQFHIIMNQKLYLSYKQEVVYVFLCWISSKNGFPGQLQYLYYSMTTHKLLEQYLCEAYF